MSLFMSPPVDAGAAGDVLLGIAFTTVVTLFVLIGETAVARRVVTPAGRTLARSLLAGAAPLAVAAVPILATQLARLINQAV